MNLLGAVLYDPSVAVSKATSSLLAMTVIDATNLTLAITVPSHGIVRFVLSCNVVGATTVPATLLGVMNHTGGAVIGRTAPVQVGVSSTTSSPVGLVAEFVVTGLSPGALQVDAGYAVQAVVASTNIKFGGPNNNSGANAWGAFCIEAWDPRPIPTATPGAANGLVIAGSNAATTFATLTSTGAFTVNGVSAVSQTGDSFARIGAAGAGLTALGDTRIGNLDAAVSTRSTYAGGAVASVTGAVGSVTGAVGSVTGAVGSVTGAVGSVTGNVGGNVVGSVASVTAGVTLAASQHVIVDSGTVTTLTNLPPITANWITAAGITAGALNGKGDWSTLAAGAAMTLTAAYDAAKTAAQAGNAMTLTGLYDAAKTAATQVSVNAIPTTPLLAINYTAPDNSGIAAIKAKTDSLAFTRPGEVDVNLQSVNDVPLIGTGAAGSEFHV